MRPLTDLLQTNDFTTRHIGPTDAEQAEMLAELGVSSLDELTETTLPESIRFTGELNVGGPVTEAQAVATTGASVASRVAAVAVRALGVAMSLTPIGLLLVGLAALVGGVLAYSNASDKTKEKVNKLVEASRHPCPPVPLPLPQRGNEGRTLHAAPGSYSWFDRRQVT